MKSQARIVSVRVIPELNLIRNIHRIDPLILGLKKALQAFLKGLLSAPAANRYLDANQRSLLQKETIYRYHSLNGSKFY